MNAKIAPCMGCNDRNPGCHDRCPRYREWAEMKSIIRKNRSDDKEDNRDQTIRSMRLNEYARKHGRH